MRRSLISVLIALCLALAPRAAEAFCGFYVSGADAKLFNNATLVVMMREGKRTVLSMQNNYQGPPEDFAMVVPVPVVLQEENVKTLPQTIFTRVDSLSAPRLVEYWEQDPCAPPVKHRGRAAAAGRAEDKDEPSAAPTQDGVKVEAQFTVGEYEIVILSAEDSGGLDRWLKREGYKIPDNAEPLLKPYVEKGSKFFVAKVNTEKVTMKDGQAMLSPLRFHYDDDEFRLPVRLGLVNSQGTQDLIVHILARGQRYAVANYPNVTIPTNIDVDDTTSARFGEFYAALFDKTLAKNMGAVVTEYAWDSGSCDPCPVPGLTPDELATLGLDVLTPNENRDEVPSLTPDSRPPPVMSPWGFVLTRLHARYGKDSLGEDLVFQKAEGIMGGREIRTDGVKLEHGATTGGMNNFQARYAIRHPWPGPVACAEPRRGIWGGPPAGQTQVPTKPATDLAFAKRDGVELASFLRSPVPELDVAPAPASPKADPKDGPKPDAPTPATDSGCGCRLGEDPPPRAAWLLLGAAVGLLLRRRAARFRG